MDDSSPQTVQDIPIGIKTDAAHRQEFDSMGYVTAPADRYWGAQTQRSLQHFSIGDDRTPKAVYHASTAAFIGLGVLRKCFPDRLTGSGWLPKLKEIIPAYGVNLIEDAAACDRIRADTAPVLKIANI